jgi:hypothetical protein
VHDKDSSLWDGFSTRPSAYQPSGAYKARIRALPVPTELVTAAVGLDEVVWSQP